MTTLLVFDAIDTAGAVLDAIGIWFLIGAGIFTADTGGRAPFAAGFVTAALLDDTGENIDPLKAWSVMMANEKPGGHGERAVAVAAVDMALWDLAAKIEEQTGLSVRRLKTGEYADACGQLLSPALQ